MDSKFTVGAICFMIIWLALIRKSQGADINVIKYGAKADGKSDDRQAITSTWKEACSSTDPSTVVIPKGKHMVGPLNFQGPCKASVNILVQGNMVAPIDLNKFNPQDHWTVFQNIDGLMVSGGGTFDGQGSLAWSQNNCAKTGICDSMPIVCAIVSYDTPKSLACLSNITHIIGSSPF